MSPAPVVVTVEECTDLFHPSELAREGWDAAWAAWEGEPRGHLSRCIGVAGTREEAERVAARHAAGGAK